ncbi:MAG: DUF6056 family protein, partial [Deferribacteraceae bacterium]|nr:DUF6056 family protein [Deferribacteraceae bacterium]
MNKRYLDKFAQNFSLHFTPVLVAAFSLFSLIALLYLYRYNFPSADDYLYSSYNGLFHERTRGFFNLLRGSLEASIECYKKANGRIAANFLYALFLAPKNLASYKIIPALIYLLFCFSFIYLTVISKVNLVLRQKLFIAVTLLALLFTCSNHIHNTFYWMGGVSNYFFSLTLFIISFSVFMKRAGKFIYLPLIIAIFPMIVVSLSNETLTFIGLWFYLVL